MTREWRGVVGLEDLYEVSNDGLVRTTPRILKPFAAKKGGHMALSLGLHRRAYVHRLVAEAFIENAAAKPLVNHKNGDPKDNTVENLEWVTHGENISHGFKNNGRVNYNCVPISAVDADGVVVESFPSMTAAAEVHGVTIGAIRSAYTRGGKCAGYNWVRA